jgi:hypothetical protein
LLPLDKIDANSAHGVKFIFQLLDHCMPGWASLAFFFFY